ncbi:MAG: PAS domain S-box protein, partial [Methanomicrobiales archaeon]
DRLESGLSNLQLNLYTTEKLMSAAGIMASEIDGDAFARLRAGDETSTDFIRIRDQLRHLKDVSPDIRYVYTMRMDGDLVEFVVDGDYGYSADAAGIGQQYSQAEPDMLAGFSAPSADEDFTTDQWGTVLSGYYPLRNSAGAIVGIVGVDMDSSKVQANLDRINLILYFVGIFALFFVAAGIIIVENRRLSDEQVLRESEEKFKTLFENSGSAIFIMDSMVFLDCNHRTETIFGCLRNEIIGQSPAALSPERQPDGHLSSEMARGFIDKALLGEPQFFEWVNLRCDGTLFNTEVSLNRIVLGGTPYVQAIVQDITERKKAETALKTVTKKLSLLNTITFEEIRNAVFALNGYLTLDQSSADTDGRKNYLEMEEEMVKKISKSLTFARSYQDLGVRPPQWQNVGHSFIMAISHLDFSQIDRLVQVENLEIYADPLLERVFFLLSDNVLVHARTATCVTIGYEVKADHLLLFFEDNGNGIPDALKEKIFERGFGIQKGMELFLSREILSITGITIQETGTPGKGARFELVVPKGVFRFVDGNGELSSGPCGSAMQYVG